MSVIKRDQIRMADVAMEGASGVSMATVLGRDEGWEGYAMRLFRVGPGGNTPRHRHDWEHVNYVVSGSGRLTVGDEASSLRQGDFAFVPPNSFEIE